MPGAIYKITLDNTHPLGFGFPKYYYSLKLSDDVYDYLGEDDWNVGTIKGNGYVSGFAGQKSKEKIKDGMLLGVQQMGRGSVVYMVDDPIFRSFLGKWQTVIQQRCIYGRAVGPGPSVEFILNIEHRMLKSND